MIRYFLATLVARARDGRALFLLTVAGVALGVAAVLSIQIINSNALGAFEGSMRAVSGDAALSVLGRTATLDETLFPEVLATPGVAVARPLVIVDVALEGREAFYLEIVGVDMLAPVELPWAEGPQAQGSPFELPGWCAISPRLASELGLVWGDTLAVSIGSRRHTLLVGALIDFTEITPVASPRLTVMDIAQAQALFGTPGRIHQIDVELREGASAEEVGAALAAKLGDRARVVTPQQRRDEAADLMAAFRLNLTALSLVSLFVGGFLVYTSTQASLVRRREEFGVLRSIGATRAQLLGVIGAEVTLVGAIGVAVGLPLGWLAAKLNVEMVSNTLSNLYLLEEIRTLRLPPSFFVLAAGIGIGAALLGALMPAIDMSRRDPRELLSGQRLHERVDRASGPLALGGLALVAAVALAWPLGLARWRPGGFVVAIALLAAMPLLAPWTLRRWTAGLTVRRFGLRYGMKALGLRLHNAAFAVAALAVAVSMLIGITLMIGSFRRTVEIWLVSTAHADVYVTSESWRRARENATLDDSLVERLRTWPGVRHVDRLRQVFVYAGASAERATMRRIALGAVDFGTPIEAQRFSMLDGDLDEVSRRVHDDGATMISEPLARKAGLGVGDVLVVAAPAGDARLPIAGVFYDYSSEAGSAAIDLRTLERLVGPGPVNSVALYLEPGRDVRSTIDALKASLTDSPLEIRSNRDLRDEVRRIFDQTFAVTRLLQAMSLLIAACGITLTLIVLARERTSELALYRALGARRRQIFRVYLGKGLGIALGGLAIGSLGGVALAGVLIFVINRAYFGWTIAVYWPWAELAQQVVTIVAAAVLASLYPAARASRVPATELSREEL